MAAQENNDHDLLIRVDTKLDRAADDLKSLGHRVEEVRHDVGVLSDNMEVKIAAAVSGKADTARMLDIKVEQDKAIDDHEKRMRFVERYVWSAIAVLTVSQFAFGVWLAFFLR